jgi:hypothetical protein
LPENNAPTRAHAERAIRLEVEIANPEQSKLRREMRDMEDLFQKKICWPHAHFHLRMYILLTRIRERHATRTINHRPFGCIRFHQPPDDPAGAWQSLYEAAAARRSRSQLPIGNPPPAHCAKWAGAWVY